MPNNLSELSSRLNLLFRRDNGTLRVPRCITMTDLHRAPDPRPLLDALPCPGAVIIRHPNRDVRQKLSKLALKHHHAYKHKILISDDIELATELGADGVHIPEIKLRTRRNVTLLRRRPHWLISASAHSARSLKHAENSKVDFILLSPIAPTKSHPGQIGMGFVKFARLARECHIPVIGLGGLTLQNILRLKSSGLAGIAGIEVFMNGVGALQLGSQAE